MSWGTKLTIAFIAFATLIGTLVYKAMHTKFELVSKDYYKEELRYQQKINGAHHAAQLSAVGLRQDSAYVTVVLPAEMLGRSVTGQLLFYCGSDAAKDLALPLQVNANGYQLVSKQQLQQGAYQLQLQWKAGADSFYVEKQIQVN